jgi:2-succinyl-6-hydroxy-2,4-cyclohexadiene-1-carboxylate synthase
MSRVVLVHGFTQTGASWARVARALATDHEVVCVDAPGHGRRHDVACDLWEGARLVGLEGDTATYVGYSMGGRLALHLALSEPAKVRSLVLVGATAGIDDDAARGARRASDEALATQVEQVGVEPFLDEWLARPLFAGLGADAQDRASRRGNTAAGLASSLRRAGTGSQEPLWDRLGELTMPVLVVVGERDDTFRALGERLVAGIPGAALAVVAGAGHAAPFERPDAFLHVLRSWLAEHADTHR